MEVLAGSKMKTEDPNVSLIDDDVVILEYLEKPTKSQAQKHMEYLKKIKEKQIEIISAKSGKTFRLGNQAEHSNLDLKYDSSDEISVTFVTNELSHEKNEKEIVKGGIKEESSFATTDNDDDIQFITHFKPHEKRQDDTIDVEEEDEMELSHENTTSLNSSSSTNLSDMQDDLLVERIIEALKKRVPPHDKAYGSKKKGLLPQAFRKPGEKLVQDPGDPKRTKLISHKPFKCAYCLSFNSDNYMTYRRHHKKCFNKKRRLTPAEAEIQTLRNVVKKPCVCKKKHRKLSKVLDCHYHHQFHYCILCGFKSTETDVFQEHFKTHKIITADRVRKCPFCDELFASDLSFNAHVADGHLSSEPFSERKNRPRNDDQSHDDNQAEADLCLAFVYAQ